MVASESSWLDLFRGENGLRIAVLAGGVGIHAVNVFLGATLLPSVVVEIGGLDLFAWNTTLFIVASIFASVFAATRPFGVGARGCYAIALAAFALGSFVCGAAFNMPVMLAGRAIQGFGAGLLVALNYAMIRVIFPPNLWPRAMALISGVWGVATLIGPAAGGIFAELGLWRWAFWSLLPFALVLGLLVLRVIPRQTGERSRTGAPFAQIVLLVGAVLLVSIASVIVDQSAPLAIGLTVLGIFSIVLLGILDRASKTHLLPRDAFRVGTPLATMFLCMLLLNMAVATDVFVPLFLQKLHGLGPIFAGYMMALIAMGWTCGSVTASGWTGRKARFLHGAGPGLMALAMFAIALLISRFNPGGDWSVLGPLVVALFLFGVGMGMVSPHLLTGVLHATPPAENDLTSAAITMVQLVASGLGAALAGLVVNLAGLTHAVNPADAAPAALWLYGLFCLVPLITIGFALRGAERVEKIRLAARPTA